MPPRSWGKLKLDLVRSSFVRRTGVRRRRGRWRRSCRSPCGSRGRKGETAQRNATPRSTSTPTWPRPCAAWRTARTDDTMSNSRIGQILARIADARAGRFARRATVWPLDAAVHANRGAGLRPKRTVRYGQRNTSLHRCGADGCGGHWHDPRRPVWLGGGRVGRAVC
jgi:hypothetical protein